MATTDTTTAVGSSSSTSHSTSHSETNDAGAHPMSPLAGASAAAPADARKSAGALQSPTASCAASTTPPVTAVAVTTPTAASAPPVLVRNSSVKPQLELELDKLEPETNHEGHTDGSDECMSDLGTPLGFHEGGFGSSADDFASHRFIGPSIAGDDASARELHGLRRVHVHAKPPRFISELASVESERRTSSSASMGTRSTSSSRSLSASEQQANAHTYSASFTEASALGFTTDVVVTQTNEVVVQVASVERESPACRAGVVEGDILRSVNGQTLASHMAEHEILEIIRTASVPRTMVFQRSASSSEAAVPAATGAASPADDALKAKTASGGSAAPGAAKKASKPLFGRFSSAVGYGSSILGSALKRKQKVVHANSFCDGCGMDPIVGPLWSCSVCPNYNLCSDCYDHGTHGLENSDALQTLHEAIVQDKLEKKCKQFTQEFLMSLRRDICKGRPDKFEYMGSWIADIVIGTAASKITVRGIEIPALSPMSRQRFVSNLMPLVSNRTDIEVNIEWLPDDAERPSVDLEDIRALGAADHDEVEKLRIWISDKKTRTTSPFA